MEAPDVAVALKAIDAGQRHIGSLHHEGTPDTLQFLHLAWHFELRNEEPRPEYVWVEPPIPAARARQVAAFCRKVWRQNGKRVPYAFSTPNDCFDKASAEFLFGPSRLGLTCATFVLALFQASGLPMVNAATWERRPGDEEWQLSIIQLLRTNRADPAHVAAVEAEAGAIRFRPEDVGGAAAHDPWPVDLNIASRLGGEIIQMLNSEPSA